MPIRFLKPAASPRTAQPQHSPPSRHGPPFLSEADSVTHHNLLDNAPATCEEPAVCDASLPAPPYAIALPAATTRAEEGDSLAAETQVQGIQSRSTAEQDSLAEADTSDQQPRLSWVDNNCQQAEHSFRHESSSTPDVVASGSAQCTEEGQAGTTAPAAPPWGEGNIDPQVLACRQSLQPLPCLQVITQSHYDFSRR